jgi:RNA polymerase sigma-70 factor, ECF subfamily
MNQDLALALRPMLEQPAESIGGRDFECPATAERLCANQSVSKDLRMARLRETVTTLYEQLHQPVFRYLLWMRVRPQDAEEILQESFLRLFSHLHADGPNLNMKAWIYRVAHNLACTRARKQKFVLETSPESWQQICLSSVDSSASPEEVLLYKEALEQLHSKVIRLSPLQQNCVRLRLEGLRYQEIAEILNTSQSSVAGSLRHAIGKLCECR